MPAGIESAVVGDLRRPVDLAEAFHDVDYIVHSAGLAHADPEVPDDVFREINAGITDVLAVAAGKAGVRRFVLLSSVRAQTGPGSDDIVTEALPARRAMPMVVPSSRQRNCWPNLGFPLSCCGQC